MTEHEKELRRAQQRRYYARHKEKCRAMTQAWLARNPDYERQESADRYMMDPEKKRARRRAYYAANRERINAGRRVKRTPSTDDQPEFSDVDSEVGGEV